MESTMNIQHNVGDTSARIMSNCQALAEAVAKLDKLIEDSSRAQAEYDKQIGLSMATHKAHGEPVGVLKEYAKRDCQDVFYTMLVAEGSLKSCYANIDAIKVRINAYQSILKYMDVMPHE